jgi:hypothetical protein
VKREHEEGVILAVSTRKNMTARKSAPGVRGLECITHSNKVQSNRPSEFVVPTVGDPTVVVAWGGNIYPASPEGTP